jgi:myosin heavy subunit
MADILSLIQQVKTKGKQMNDNLGAFATNNQTFKQSLLTNLKNIQDTLAKINFQDLGNNKVALLEANKNLEATKLQLQEKQQQLAEINKQLESSRQQTEAANKNLQDVNNQMQALDKQNRENMEQMQKQQQLALEEARNASLKEQQQMRQQFEQERQQLQSEFDKQRAQIEQEKNQAQLAAQEATQKLSQLEAGQAQIQSGLAEIDTLLDNQLKMIENVVNSSPSTGDLNNLIDVIQANLVAGINMLSQTKQSNISQKGFDLPSTLAEFRNLRNEQARQDFYRIIPGDKANQLNALIRTGNMAEAEQLYADLLRLYNERYGRVTRGGKRKTKRRTMRRKRTYKRSQR